MKDLEFLRNVSIGQYVHMDSPVHRLHPGIKLTVLIFLMTSALIAPDISSQFLLFIQLVIYIKVAGLSARFILRGMIPALPYLAFIAVLQLLFTYNSPDGRMLWSSPALGSYRINISFESLLSVAMLFARFFNLMTVFTFFSAATNTNEITNGVEQFFSPLKALRFPAHEAALILAITFRFIPILAAEAERIVKAQAARGADFGTHTGGPIKRTVRFLPILLPMFQNALERAEALIEAMETKCYTGGKGRTSFVTFKVRRADIAGLLIAASLCAVTCFLGYTGVISIPISIQ